MRFSLKRMTLSPFLSSLDFRFLLHFDVETYQGFNVMDCNIILMPGDALIHSILCFPEKKDGDYYLLLKYI